MQDAKRWRVAIYIGEDRSGRRTYAKALLEAGSGEVLSGYGTAWRNPTDREVPEIGDELAVSRALADLAEQLEHAAPAT
jgi:hypothetical protein